MKKSIGLLFLSAIILASAFIVKNVDADSTCVLAGVPCAADVYFKNTSSGQVLGNSTQAPSCYAFSRNLTVGSSGDDVTALQKFLVAKGFLVVPRGAVLGGYGPGTKASVAAYQASKGLSPADGYFGPVTRQVVMADCGGVVPSISFVQAKAADNNVVYSGETMVVYGKNLDGGTKVYLKSPAGVYQLETSDFSVEQIKIVGFNADYIPDGYYDLYAVRSGSESNRISVQYINHSSRVKPVITSFSDPAKVGELFTTYIKDGGDRGSVVIKTFDGSKMWFVPYTTGEVYNGFVYYDGNKVTFTVPSSIGRGQLPENTGYEEPIPLKTGSYNLYVYRTDGSKSDAVAITIYDASTPITPPRLEVPTFKLLQSSIKTTGTTNTGFSTGLVATFSMQATARDWDIIKPSNSDFTVMFAKSGSGTQIPASSVNVVVIPNSNIAAGTTATVTVTAQLSAASAPDSGLYSAYINGIRYTTQGQSITQTTEEFRTGTANFISSATPTSSTTASLTGNGSRMINVKVGDTINYVWSSTNADSFNSEYILGSGGANCPKSGAWVITNTNGKSGSQSSVVPTSLAGCVYHINYNVKNTSTKAAQSDTVTVAISNMSTPAPVSTCYAYTRTLALGSSGADVTALQKFLIAKGFLSAGASLGSFNSATQTALAKYQATKGITATGGFGSAAIAAVQKDCVIPVSNSTQPTVTIISPNGGEIYTVGTQVPIKFVTNLTDQQTTGMVFQLYKKTNDSFGKMYVQDIAANWLSGSPYNWTIPTSLPSDNYYIYANAQRINLPPEVTDFSDSSFTISGATPPVIIAQATITVTSPGKGAQYKVGDNLNIKWTSTGIPRENEMTFWLRAYTDGKEYPLDIKSSNDGNGDIIIPSSIPSGQYNVKVKTSVNGTSFIGSSDGALMIASITTPPITPPTTPPVSTCYAYTRTLALGSSGADVTALQKFLIAKGFLSAGAASGSFNSATQTALAKYQAKKGITATGGFGSTTISAVKADC